MKNEWLYLVFRNLPINRKKIFVSSFRGLYCDNPRAISEEIHRLDQSIKIIWEKSNDSKSTFPDYATVVKHGSIAQIYHQTTAAVILENGSGYFFVKWKSKFSKRFQYYKNPRTVDVATWHGTPLKHIGADIPGGQLKKDEIYSSADFLISGSDYEYEIYKKAFPSSINLLKLGNARNDRLLLAQSVTEKEKAQIKSKLGLPSNEKVVLYAPTFRDNVEDSGLKQLNEIDENELLQVLEEKFGGKWCFVFRAHQKVFSELQKERKWEKKHVHNGNVSDDMVDYLIVSDCVITDYSGSLFDLTLTSTPCFLYAHDRQRYISEERGTYIALEDLPYKFADSFSELLYNIKNYHLERDTENKRAFADKMRIYNAGIASEKQALFILNLMKNHNIKENKVKSLN